MEEYRRTKQLFGQGRRCWGSDTWPWTVKPLLAWSLLGRPSRSPDLVLLLSCLWLVWSYAISGVRTNAPIMNITTSFYQAPTYAQQLNTMQCYIQLRAGAPKNDAEKPKLFQYVVTITICSAKKNNSILQKRCFIFVRTIHFALLIPFAKASSRCFVRRFQCCHVNL